MNLFEYRLCDKCFQLYNFNKNTISEFCIIYNCNGNLVIIDEPLIPIIQTLWKKNYKTRFCCSGHFSTNSLYITFYENYHFDLYPKGFVEERTKIRTNMDKYKNTGPVILTLRGKKDNIKTRLTNTIEAQRYLNKKINSLLDWVEKIKPNEKKEL